MQTKQKKKKQFWNCCILEWVRSRETSHSGNHPEEIYTNKFMWSKLDYIHLNPFRTGIAKKASDYIYSSTSNYVLDVGFLDSTKADNPIIDVLNPNSFLKFNNY
jgi:hypothetical protein